MWGVVGESGGVGAVCIGESGLCVAAWCHLCLCLVAWSEYGVVFLVPLLCRGLLVPSCGVGSPVSFVLLLLDGVSRVLLLCCVLRADPPALTGVSWVSFLVRGPLW